jgi:hypothetical protein
MELRPRVMKARKAWRLKHWPVWWTDPLQTEQSIHHYEKVQQMMLTTGGKPISAITIAFIVIQPQIFYRRFCIQETKFNREKIQKWVPEIGTTDKFNNIP